jgi:hypothetical protein
MVNMVDSTRVTASVSPSARLRPSSDAAMIPLRLTGSTARRSISEREAPSASAAST